MSAWRLAAGAALCGTTALVIAVGSRDFISLRPKISDARIEASQPISAIGTESFDAAKAMGESQASVAAAKAVGEGRAAIVAAEPRDAGSLGTEIVAEPIKASEATATRSEPIDAPRAAEEDRAAATDAAVIDAALPASPPPPETPPVEVASTGTPESAQVHANEEVEAVKPPDGCLLDEACIDQYLFSLYQRTPKLDAVKKQEQVKVTVTKNGKTRTVTKTVAKLVDEDFGWKDPKAAERAGMPLMDYVIGGMDRSFKLKLYHALRAMDEAGLEPGITSAFRDDYRQMIASGKKAANDSSYHGGSRRGGYGHGAAADLVSVKGETRDQRFASSEALWKWIDTHEKELGVGRPYLDRDPPHVGAIDGKEYIAKRGGGNSKLARSERHKRGRPTTAKVATATSPESDATKTAAASPASDTTKTARTATLASAATKIVRTPTPASAATKSTRTAHLHQL